MGSPASPEQLLLQFGMDLSPLKSGASQIQDVLTKLNEMAKGISTQTTTASKQQLEAINQVKAAAQAAVVIAKSHSEEEKAKASTIRTQAEEYKKLAAEQRVSLETSRAATAVEVAKRAEIAAQTADIQKQIQARRLETAEIQKQIAELRARRYEEGGGGEKGKRGGFLGILGAISPGLGAAAGAVAGGELLGEGLKLMIEKLKEITKEAGSISLLDDQFRKLATGSGVDANKMLAEMQEHTEGLISRFMLLQTGSAALKSRMLKPSEIAETMGAVVKVAESQGRSAEAAIQAFNNALTTGRAAGLARQVGIPRAATTVPLAPGLSPFERQKEQVEQQTRIIREYANSLGDVPATFEQMEKRISVAVNNIMTSFGQGINESPGAQIFLEFFNNIGKSMNDIADKAKGWGKTVGDGLAVAATVIKAMVPLFESLWNLLKDTLITVGQLIGLFVPGLGDIEKGGSKVKQQFEEMHPVMTKIVAAFGGLVILTQKVLDNIDGFIKRIKENETTLKIIGVLAAGAVALAAPHVAIGAGLVGMGIKYGAFSGGGGPGEAGGQPKDIIEELAEKMEQFQNMLNKPKPGVKAPGGGDQETWQQMKKIADLTLQLQKENDKIFYEQHKAYLDDLKRLDDEAYRDGEESLTAHYEKQLKIAEDQRDAKEAEITADLLAKKEELKKTRLPGRIGTKEYNLQVEIAEKVAQAEIDKAEADYQRNKYQLEKQVDADRLAAKRTAIAAELQLEQQRIAELDRLNKKQFEEGGTAPGMYRRQQLESIQARYQIEIQGAANAYAAGEKNAINLQKLNDAVAKAQQQAEIATTNVIEQEGDNRLKYLQNTAGSQLTLLQTALGVAQKPAPGQVAAVAPSTIISRIMDNLSSQRQSLTNQLTDPTTDPKLWDTIAEKLMHVIQLQQQYNEELEKMHDTIIPIASVFGVLGGGVSSVFRSKFAQNLGAELTSGAAYVARSKDIGETLSKGGGLFKSGAPSGASPGEVIGAFTDKLQAAVQAVSGFVDALANAKSPIAGGAGGAIAGLGIGNTLDQVFKGLGPIGAIAGTAIGAIGGIVAGSKNAQIQRNITQLNQQFKEITQSFAQNSNNLQNTIAQLQLLVQMARQEQSQTKKGGAQYQQLIDQYNQQIMQLQNQQVSVLRNLKEMLAVVTAPVGAQDFLSSLQSILKQYQQFEGAAQTAKDLADANQFLVSSLNNYTVQMQGEYAQANEQAIQDAINLNDLLYQRVQLQIQFNNQIAGIMEQGVLTRQMTFAQQKGSQIYLAQQEYERQMQNLNEQITVANYKVQAEQQIFSLATTRVALEQQLAQVQIQQAAMDIQRVAALAGLLQALQSGNWNNGLLAGLIATLPGVTNPNIPGGGAATAPGAPAPGGWLGALVQQLQGQAAQFASPQVPPTVDTSGLDALVASAYQDRASSGYASFRAANL